MPNEYIFAYVNICALCAHLLTPSQVKHFNRLKFGIEMINCKTIETVPANTIDAGSGSTSNEEMRLLWKLVCLCWKFGYFHLKLHHKSWENSSVKIYLGARLPSRSLESIRPYPKPREEYNFNTWNTTQFKIFV